MRYLKNISLTISAFCPIINVQTGYAESYTPRCFEITGLGFSVNEVFNHFCEHTNCKVPVLHNAKIYKVI